MWGALVCKTLHLGSDTSILDILKGQNIPRIDVCDLELEPFYPRTPCIHRYKPNMMAVINRGDSVMRFWGGRFPVHLTFTVAVWICQVNMVTQGTFFFSFASIFPFWKSPEVSKWSLQCILWVKGGCLHHFCAARMCRDSIDTTTHKQHHTSITHTSTHTYTKSSITIHAQT